MYSSISVSYKAIEQKYVEIRRSIRDRISPTPEYENSDQQNYVYARIPVQLTMGSF